MYFQHLHFLLILVGRFGGFEGKNVNQLISGKQLELGIEKDNIK